MDGDSRVRLQPEIERRLFHPGGVIQPRDVPHVTQPECFYPSSMVPTIAVVDGINLGLIFETIPRTSECPQ
jgi:hypothetical protein